MSSERQIRIWCIGSDGTEYYAAFSEEEMRAWYIQCVGEKQAAKDFNHYFEEVPQASFDEEFDFKDDNGDIVKTTWRKVLAEYDEKVFPTQISTSYV